MLKNLKLDLDPQVTAALRKILQKLPGGTRGRRWLSLLAVALVSLLGLTDCSDRPPVAPGSELRVATWNIRWFPSGRPIAVAPSVERQIIGAAAREVRKAEPHIICLQEIRDREAAAELARSSRLPGLKVVACTEFAPFSEDIPAQQVAILSNLPLVEGGYEPWRASGYVDPPRGYAYAVLETPAGLVAVFAVHLKSNFITEGRDVERLTTLNRLKRELSSTQLQAAADRLGRRLRRPVTRVILAGDFNTSLDDPRWTEESTLRGLEEAGFRSCFEGMPPRRTKTLPATDYYPAVTFDYIWHRGFSEQHDTHVHPKRWVSDHRMVSVRLVP